MPQGESAEAAALQVVTVDWEPVDGEKALFGRAREAVARVSSVSVAQMAKHVAELCRYVDTVFREASTPTDNLELKTLEVNVEVTATGELRLIGAASTQVKGGLKLVFGRPSA